MKELENKFIVINKKRLEEMNEIWQKEYPLENHPEVDSFLITIDRLYWQYHFFTKKLMNQQYIVCNQDEPYAEQVKNIVLGKPENNIMLKKAIELIEENQKLIEDTQDIYGEGIYDKEIYDKNKEFLELIKKGDK